MTLGELLTLSRGVDPPGGGVAGVCIFCGRETGDGYKPGDRVSGNFSGWNRLYSGNCFCPSCAYLFSDQAFRKRSWLASLAGFEFLTLPEGPDNRLRALLDPPEPPFFVYICRVGHRQSWLSCLHRVARSRDRYWLAHEDYDVPVLFERERAERYVELIRRARGLRITKTELKAGRLRPQSARRLLEAGIRELAAELAGCKGDPLWEVMLHVVRDEPGERAEAG